MKLRLLRSFLVVTSFALAESGPAAAQATLQPYESFGTRVAAPWKPEHITGFYSMKQDAPVAQAIDSAITSLIGGFPDTPIVTRAEAKTLAAQCNAKYPVATPDWSLWKRIGCAASISYRETHRKIYTTPKNSNDRNFPCQRYERAFNYVMANIDKPQNVSWSIGAIGLQGSSTSKFRDGKIFAHVLNRLTISVGDFKGRLHSGKARLTYALDIGWEGKGYYGMPLHPASTATLNFHANEVYDSAKDFPIPGTSADSLKNHRDNYGL